MRKFEDFVKENRDKVFRYWVLKKVWTPYEENLQDPDQSIYRDPEAEYAYITDLFELPDGGIMLELRERVDSDYSEYYLLDDIELALCEEDQDEE